MIALSMQLLAWFAGPEVTLLAVGVTLEVVRQLKLTGAVEGQG